MSLPLRPRRPRPSRPGLHLESLEGRIVLSAPKGNIFDIAHAMAQIELGRSQTKQAIAQNMQDNASAAQQVITDVDATLADLRQQMADSRQQLQQDRASGDRAAVQQDRADILDLARQANQARAIGRDAVRTEQNVDKADRAALRDADRAAQKAESGIANGKDINVEQSLAETRNALIQGNADALAGRAQDRYGRLEDQLVNLNNPPGGNPPGSNPPGGTSGAVSSNYFGSFNLTTHGSVDENNQPCAQPDTPFTGSIDVTSIKVNGNSISGTSSVQQYVLRTPDCGSVITQSTAGKFQGTLVPGTDQSTVTFAYQLSIPQQFGGGTVATSFKFRGTITPTKWDGVILSDAGQQTGGVSMQPGQSR